MPYPNEPTFHNPADHPPYSVRSVFDKPPGPSPGGGPNTKKGGSYVEPQILPNLIGPPNTEFPWGPTMYDQPVEPLPFGRSVYPTQGLPGLQDLLGAKGAMGGPMGGKPGQGIPFR